jgi:site-specific recombinase XerD
MLGNCAHLQDKEARATLLGFAQAWLRLAHLAQANRHIAELTVQIAHQRALDTGQRRAFKRDLSDQRGHRSGEPLSKATLYATLTALKRFFVWLAGQPGYKSRISYADADYFNLSAKETRIAKATRPARVPTLEQIRHVIQSMPATTDIERRDRALIAFTILTGARDGAVASFKQCRDQSAYRLDSGGKGRLRDR